MAGRPGWPGPGCGRRQPADAVRPVGPDVPGADRAGPGRERGSRRPSADVRSSGLGWVPGRAGRRHRRGREGPVLQCRRRLSARGWAGPDGSAGSRPPAGRPVPRPTCGVTIMLLPLRRAETPGSVSAEARGDSGAWQIAGPKAAAQRPDVISPVFGERSPKICVKHESGRVKRLQRAARARRDRHGAGRPVRRGRARVIQSGAPAVVVCETRGLHRTSARMRYAEVAETPPAHQERSPCERSTSSPPPR